MSRSVDRKLRAPALTNSTPPLARDCVWEIWCASCEIRRANQTNTGDDATSRDVILAGGGMKRKETAK
jgi:hypothetical protein